MLCTPGAELKYSDWGLGCYSPFRLSGADVDWGARRSQLLGENVHPHLDLSLEPE